MITLDQAVVEFLISCRADGLRPATVRWYRHLLTLLGGRFAGQPLDQIRPAALREYILDLRARDQRYVDARNRPTINGGLSKESLRDHLRAIKRFFNWSVMEYDLNPAANPMLKIKLPGRERSEPKAIALDDLRALLLACDESPYGLRDKAMIAFLADTGCRAGGLLTLTDDRVHLDRGYAIVIEKGQRQRAVPFTPYTANLLTTWLKVRPANARTVFCSLASQLFGQPLTLAGLSIRLKTLKARAGIAGRVNPHSFRHGFARAYLQNGGDLATLAQLMGHSSVEVTASYYALFTHEELAAKHGQFSPITNLEVKR